MLDRNLVPLFWTKVEILGRGGCWLWRAALNSEGYGKFRTGQAHRIAYEELIGPIPESLALDHLCRVHHCVNPTHLEPVTWQENILRSPVIVAAVNARKTHCHKGHEFTVENTLIRRQGAKVNRTCRTCRREYGKLRRAQAKSA